MSSPDEPDTYIAVAKFNSKNGGALSVTVTIPERFRGFETLNLLLLDENGAKIFGNFVNIPAEEPVEEPAAEEPVEEPVAEEPIADESTVETAASEEPAADAPIADESTVETTVSEEPAEERSVVSSSPAAEPAAEAPALTCDYSVIPTVSIDAVTRNASVTFTTANFPANSTFSVSMGVYVATWQPEPMGPRHPDHRPGPQPEKPVRPEPRPIYVNEDWPTFYPLSGAEAAPVPSFPDKETPHHHGPAPRPDGQPVVSSVFSGTQVGTFETGDGTPQTLTFEIPATLAGVNPIALWISDLGPCGFYSYNYFYNNSTN